jgi:3-hydroxyisobutyrate dehydrogenase-like beta-hydroxyacid dehydrogenase
MFAAGIALAESVLNTGERLGLDRGTLGEILSSGSGRSFALEIVAGAAGRDVSEGIRPYMIKDVTLLRAVLGDTETNRVLTAAQWVLSAPAGEDAAGG